MEDSSNDGVKEECFCCGPAGWEDGVCDRGGGEMVRSVWNVRWEAPEGGEGVECAGFGAIDRLRFARPRIGVPDGDGDSELLCGGCAGGGVVRMGSVSARSTMVFKESMSGSHDFSVRWPAPAATTVRARMAYIFRRVLPAYIFGSLRSCIGMFRRYAPNDASQSVKALVSWK
jgi:hypothetical protein